MSGLQNSLAFYDPLLAYLTGVFDRLQHAVASSLRKGSQSAVRISIWIIADINDTLSYEHGDLLLEQTARRLDSA
jgi:GGDEF domain-containing protein